MLARLPSADRVCLTGALRQLTQPKLKVRSRGVCAWGHRQLIDGNLMTSAEAKRLEELYALEILDTPREERFDRITRTAVRLFRMPNSLLAFVDETRAWVKSEVGTSIDWVPRKSSFSDLAIESDVPVVVPDARNDPR